MLMLLRVLSSMRLVRCVGMTLAHEERVVGRLRSVFDGVEGLGFGFFAGGFGRDVRDGGAGGGVVVGGRGGHVVVVALWEALSVPLRKEWKKEGRTHWRRASTRFFFVDESL